MEAKHTAAPWRIEHENDVGPNDEGYWEWLQVGPARVDLPRNDGIGIVYERAHADARLISAAPEMLAALEAAVECGMIPVSSAREGGAMAYVRQTHVADMIRAAIAKAKGA